MTNHYIFIWYYIKLNHKKSHLKIMKWLFAKFIKNYFVSVVNPAFKYSLFNRAMFETEMPLGHSASHA